MKTFSVTFEVETDLEDENEVEMAILKALDLTPEVPYFSYAELEVTFESEDED